MRTDLSAKRDTRFVQALFWLAYVALVLKFMLSLSQLLPWPDFLNTVTEGAFICLILLKLSTQRYTPIQVVGLGFVLALCAYSSKNASYSSPTLSFLLIMASQDVDLLRVLRTGYRMKAAIILIHAVCYGVLVAVSHIGGSYLYWSSTVRPFFFAGHSNMLSSYVLWASIEYIYVNYKKLSAPVGLLLFGINALTYIFTDSRTSWYISIAICILLIWEKSGSRLTDAVLRLFVKYGFGLFSVLCIGLTVVYTPTLSGRLKALWLMLNQLFTGRLVFGAYAYNQFGFTWLGRKLTMPDKVYYNGHWLDGVIFDNAYQWMFLVYGSVFLILVSLAFFFMARRLNSIELVIISVFILYALMEAYIVNVIVCFPLLILGRYLYPQRQETAPLAGVEKEEVVPLWKQRSA